ncbi:MAG: response regulator [Alphaproteobacteria bacterium]|nr:response regulator [Alphaproteobacteria bacterium]
MLVKSIDRDAEKVLMDTVDACARMPSQKGQILFCAFSALEESIPPKVLNETLKSVLSDQEAECYVCSDRDTFIYWKTSLENEHSLIIKAIQDNYPRAFLSVRPDKIFKSFNTSTEIEDLRSMILGKIALLTKTTSPQEQKQNLLSLSPLQSTLLKKAQERRATRSKTEILVVEDQDFSRKLLMGLMQKEHLCYGAKNAAEAIQYFVEQAPDIIFLDIELPDHDGHCLAKLFRQLDTRAFIVMVTGNNYQKDVDRAKENGVNGFIAKPYNKQSIYNAVQSFLQSKQGRA